MEALEESEETGGGSIARLRQSGGISNETNLILDAELVLGFTELEEALRRVVGPVETGLVCVELVEALVDATDRVLLGGKSTRSTACSLGGRLQSKGNPPGGLVFLGLHIAREEEATLLHADLARLLGNRDNRETNLTDPRVHERVDVLTGGLAQSRPQVIRGSIAILEGIQVLRNTKKEGLSTKVGTQHANDGASLQVADVVKNLIDLEGIPDGHFNGVGVAKGVEGKC